MKKFLLLCGSVLVFGGVAQAYGGGGGGGGGNRPSHYRYRVTVYNLTKGQPLTPSVVVAHNRNFKAYHLGGQASDGLADLAQDGATAALKEEFDAKRSVYATAVGDGVFMPGTKQSVVIRVPANKSPAFTVFSMLARTNDAFIAATGNAGQQKVFARVYDAGVEHNTEKCAHIPAPPCGNHDVGTDGGEGFVRFHEGLHLQGNLSGLRDTFANIAAKVKIERLR